MEAPVIMRALETEVVDAVWAAVEPLLPPPDRSHPLGCHRPRVPDRLCFWGILIRLVTGASWVDIEAILEHRVSDTTLRARRDEWIAAGVFEALKTEAVTAFDRVIGLRLENVALDGSLHKAPYGGEGTGPNPCDRAKLGGKWSVAVDGHGIPIGWTIDGATATTSTSSSPPSMRSGHLPVGRTVVMTLAGSAAPIVMMPVIVYSWLEADVPIDVDEVSAMYVRLFLRGLRG